MDRNLWEFPNSVKLLSLHKLLHHLAFQLLFSPITTTFSVRKTAKPILWMQFLAKRSGPSVQAVKYSMALPFMKVSFFGRIFASLLGFITNKLLVMQVSDSKAINKCIIRLSRATLCGRNHSLHGWAGHDGKGQGPTLLFRSMFFFGKLFKVSSPP